jgi:HlyD family secretion protein
VRARSIFLGGFAIVVVLVAVGTTLPTGPTGSVEFDLARAELPAAETAALSAPGRVEPISEDRDLAATAMGRIVYVAAEGDRVAEGDVVAEIDNADLRAQLASAEARVRVMQSQLERLKNGARSEEIRQAEASVAESEATRRFATVVLERTMPLAGRGFASMEALDRARADADRASAHTRLLAEQLALLKAPPRREDVAIAQANLEVTIADADAFRAAIEKTRLRSPIAGVVLRRYKALGETVSIQPASLIAKVGDLSRLRVRADVDEADVARVAVGQRVWAMADAYGNQRFMGTVTRVGLRLGRKEVVTEAPTEKLDTKVLQVLVDLDETVQIPDGLRVDVFFGKLPDGANQNVVGLK